jgi:hypothetical protein
LGSCEDRPRDGDALLLAARELVALLADDHVVAIRLLDDKLVGVGGAGGAQDLVKGCARLAVSDVFGDSPVEQKRLLGHQADLRTQIL